MGKNGTSDGSFGGRGFWGGKVWKEMFEVSMFFFLTGDGLENLGASCLFG